MKYSILIFNPTAKRASKKTLSKAADFLRSRGYRVEILYTKNKGHAEVLAREAIKERPSLVIAGGGDGTFNEVLNGIIGSDIPMAILPMGTTNVLAKEIGVPENAEKAIEFALSKKPRIVSLGKISIIHNSSIIIRYFILMAGIGFDGEAVFRIKEIIKRILGKGAYIFSGFETLSTYCPKELNIYIDGKPNTGYSVIVSNVSKYGGNFKITPDARLTDPSFYVCIFKGKRRIDILKYVIGIITGTHLRFDDVEYIKAHHVKVKGDAHIQIDGDYFGKGTSDIEIVPYALRLLF